MPLTLEDISSDAFKVIGIYAKYRQGASGPPDRTVCIAIDNAIRHAIDATRNTSPNNHAFFVAFQVFFDATNPFRPH